MINNSCTCLEKKKQRNRKQATLQRNIIWWRTPRPSHFAEYAVPLPFTLSQSCDLSPWAGISKCNTVRGLERACLIELICSCPSAITMKTCLLYLFVFRIFVPLSFPLRTVSAASYNLACCAFVFHECQSMSEHLWWFLLWPIGYFRSMLFNSHTSWVL